MCSQSWNERPVTRSRIADAHSIFCDETGAVRQEVVKSIRERDSSALRLFLQQHVSTASGAAPPAAQVGDTVTSGPGAPSRQHTPEAQTEEAKPQPESGKAARSHRTSCRFSRWWRKDIERGHRRLARVYPLVQRWADEEFCREQYAAETIQALVRGVQVRSWLLRVGSFPVRCLVHRQRYVNGTVRCATEGRD